MSDDSTENQINVQGYNIVTILKRLEAATSRLEDITIFQEDIRREDTPKATPTTTTPANPVNASSDAPVNSATESTPAFVTSFNSFVSKHLPPFVALSGQIDPLVGQAAETLAAAFSAQSSFLEITSKAKKASMDDPNLLKILAPINEQIGKIMEIKETNRQSPFFNHLNTLAEGSPVLGWVVTDTPVSFVPDFKDSARFWSDRILKEHKGDQTHVDWVNAFASIFDDLKAYVKEFHTTGLTWNKDGSTLEEVVKGPTTSGSAPPPPPPPPADLFDSKPAGGMNAVFNDLNKGENITSGLKKVDKSEMTHKNPALRAQAPAKPAPPKKPTAPKKPSALSAIKKKPARKELVDGTKWIVENFTDADVSAPIVIEAEMHQSVFIGSTVGVTVQIKGKANAVSLSETTKTGVVVDSLISGVDVIKSVKFGLQVLGVVPMVSVDKSDEGAIYLSKESAEKTQIYTSSTTALNVNVPKGEDDYGELSVPEQFLHEVRGGRLVSSVVEHAG